MTIPASAMYADSAQPVAESKRVPVEDAAETSNVAGTVPQWIYDSLLRSYEAERAMRKDSSALFHIGSLLEEVVSVQRQILAVLGTSSDSRSSVALEQNSKGVNISVKAYSSSDIAPAESAALEAYLRLKAQFDGVEA